MNTALSSNWHSHCVRVGVVWQFDSVWVPAVLCQLFITRSHDVNAPFPTLILTLTPPPHQPHPLPPPDYTHLLHSWVQYEATLTVYTLMMRYDGCRFVDTYTCVAASNVSEINSSEKWYERGHLSNEPRMRVVGLDGPVRNLLAVKQPHTQLHHPKVGGVTDRLKENKMPS